MLTRDIDCAVGIGLHRCGYASDERSLLEVAHGVY